ncbi:AraC family transcriptional regulator [Nonomuraea sp. WAC 01424]|uniref:helix-turn-helix domain-containing protein n=1 Tax=Nonomuraea sp. WAC 01424 TaxID=2203200 RepID=UPI001C8B6EB9|nr:AraC family transcriptional regulator [Nonomuraea sp. WAC 01424]
MNAENLSVPAAELMIVGHFDKPAGYGTRRPHGSPSWLLLWTQAGEGGGGEAGASFAVREGDLAVLGPGAAQRYRVAPGAGRWRFWWVHFQPRPAWTAWLAPYALAAGCHLVEDVPAGVRERVGRAFERALQDARWLPGHTTPGPPTPGNAPVPAVVMSSPARELVLGAVEEVLVLATASTGAARSGGEGGGGDERVRHALDLIAAEPGAPHSVASLARAVALSPSRFAHLFAAGTGQAPMAAVRRARVRHAASLLEVTDLDVGQVAAASGFVSPFHFSRAFRREYGLPPRDYRARLRP